MTRLDWPRVSALARQHATLSKLAVAMAAIALILGFWTAASVLSSNEVMGDGLVEADGERAVQSCLPGDDPTPSSSLPSEPGELQGLDAELIVEGLVDPVDVMQLPGWDLLLVAEKPGRIVAVKNEEILDPPILDISDRVSSESNERGLVTIEAHPRFAENCRLILFFTDLQGDSNLVSATVEGTTLPRIDPDSMETLLVIPQKQQYHQSGSMVFAPDGTLWLSVGDGGLGQEKNAQDPQTLEGSVIRLDVDSGPYVAVGGNPFGVPVNTPDSWSIGLRNPWRITLDPQNGIAYVPDTGFEATEEINIAPMSQAGLNFGWPVTEGSECVDGDECDTTAFTFPTFSYPRRDGNCAVIGGEVYRGAAMPELSGQYFFGDFCSGNIWSLRYESGAVTNVTDWSAHLDVGATLTSFGTDTAGEMYVTMLSGQVWKIVPERS